MTTVISLEGHDDRVWHCAWSPDGCLLATCGADKVVRLWKKNDEQWTCVETLEDTQSRTIRCAEWSPCGSFLATASFDSTTVIWQRGVKEESNEIEWQVVGTLEGPESEIKSVAWSSDGSLIAICSRDKSIWIFDAPQPAKPTGPLAEEEFELECVSVLSGHSGDVKFLLWHPLKHYLFSASYDDTIRVWAEDNEDYAVSDFLQGHTNTVWGLALNSNGTKLVSCSQDNSLRMWYCDDREKWVPGNVYEKIHERTIFSVHWSPDDKYVLSSSGDDSIVIQEVEGDSLKVAQRIEHAHSSDVNCVRFNPKVVGMFASVGDDSLVKIWQM